MKSKVLGILIVFSLLIAACGAGAPVGPGDIPNWGNNYNGLPIEGGKFVGLPPQVEMSRQQASAANGLVTYTGSNGYVAVVGGLARASGIVPEHELYRLDGFQSFKAMRDSGYCWICMNRDFVSDHPGGFNPRQLAIADDLFVTFEWPGNEKPVGAGFVTAQWYAQQAVDSRLFDPVRSQQNLASAESVILKLEAAYVSGMASPEEVAQYQFAKQVWQFEKGRLNFYNQLMTLPPDKQQLYQLSTKTPVVYEFSPFAREELTNRMTSPKVGVASRTIYSSIPMSRVVRVFLPEERMFDVGVEIQRLHPHIEVVGIGDSNSGTKVATLPPNMLRVSMPGGFKYGASIWRSFPQGMYNLLFGAAVLGERILTYYIPMAGWYTFVFTPAGIVAVDRFVNSNDYNTLWVNGSTNLTFQEYHELHTTALETLENFGYAPEMGVMKGIYQPWLEFTGTTTANAVQVWNTSMSIMLGGTVELPMIARTGTVVDCITPGGMSDCVLSANAEFPALKITLQGWSPEGYPTIYAESTDANGNILAGSVTLNNDPGNPQALISAGCELLPEYNNGQVSRKFALRWITSSDRQTVRFFSRPYFSVSDTCDQ